MTSFKNINRPNQSDVIEDLFSSFETRWNHDDVTEAADDPDDITNGSGHPPHSPSSIDLEQVTAAAIALEQQLEQAGALNDPGLQQNLEQILNFCQHVSGELASSSTLALERDLNVIHRQVSGIVRDMRRSQTLDSIFQAVTDNLQEILNSDRVLLYRFDRGNQGTVVMETLIQGWTPSFSESLPILLFGARDRQEFQRQPSLTINNMQRGNLSPHQRQLVEKFQVRSSLQQAILLGDQVWGLLVVQQCRQMRTWRETEAELLRQTAKELTLALQPVQLNETLQRQVEREKAIVRIVDQILQATDVQRIYATTVKEIRRFLNADRVAVFQFYPESGFDDGEFVAEDVAAGFPSAIAAKVHDHCFGTQYADKYRSGGIQAVSDIYAAGLSSCHIDILGQFDIRANLIVPLLKDTELWGLLCIHQCRGPRDWSEDDISFAQQVAAQFSVARQQAEYLEQTRRAADREKAIARIVEQILRESGSQQIYSRTVKEVRKFLNTDRVAVFQFYPESGFDDGEFVAEDVDPRFPSAIAAKVHDHCFGTQYADKYRNGGIQAIADIQAEGLSLCHISILSQFDIRANLIVPLLKDTELWGLLCVHQCQGPRDWSEDDISFVKQIAAQFSVARQQADYLEQAQRVADREKAVNRIVERIRKSLSTQEIVEATAREMRLQLNCDRVAVYRFEPDWSGKFIAESVAPNWAPLVGPGIETVWPDTYLQETQGGRYKRNESFAVEDIYTIGHSVCHVEILEQFQIRAYAVVPIFQGQILWGMLAAYQNSGPRRWKEDEVGVLKQIGGQMSVAIQQAKFLEETQQQSQQLAKLAKQGNDSLRLISRLGNRIFEATRDSIPVGQILELSCRELRKQLHANRVSVYRFNPDGSGEVTSEDADAGWVNLVGATELAFWEDTYLQETQGGRYKNNETFRANTIDAKSHTDAQIMILERFQAKAYICAPIFKNNQLWGVLGVYQNDGPRQWEDLEEALVSQVSAQIGLALQEIESAQQLANSMARQKATERVIQKIRSTIDLKDIFKTTTQEVCRLLGVERVTIYKFRPDFFGDFVEETVLGSYPNLVGSGWEDPYLNEHKGGRFRSNDPLIVDDIYEGERLWENRRFNDLVPPKPMTDCHVEALKFYEVRACAVVAIFQGDQLWGLLSAFQNTRSRHWEEEEIRLLMQIANQMGIALNQAESAAQLQRQTEEERLVARINERIARSDALDRTLRATVSDLRAFLETDRVVVFRFKDETGYQTCEAIAEDVEKGHTSALGSAVTDHCFGSNMAELYSKGRYWVAPDIYQERLAECHIAILEQFQVKANIVVPLMSEDKLWGLFCVHDCAGPRDWTDKEIKLILQVGTQLAVAIQQVTFITRLQQQAVQLKQAADREKIANDSLQREIIQLLSSVRPALDGDLTVRAPVTEDLIGTVADAYNNTIQSLRQLVSQVKAAATQVNQTSEDSQSAVAQMAEQTQREFQEIDQALDQIQAMVKAARMVSTNAMQVETAVQQANQTVQQGDQAMNRTVEGILAIRDTVAETTRKIKRLSESSQKISKVVSLISNFTTQTNLLALNAAIEATRAGEYGRGFAVVADEVRSLAQQSAEATAEIERLVQEIQAETSSVSRAMDEGIEQVVKGTDLVTETRLNLNAIVQATSQISELVQHITQATQAQNEQSESVIQIMNSLTHTANQTYSQSRQISTSFQKLLGMSETLRASVGKFKVD